MQAASGWRTSTSLNSLGTLKYQGAWNADTNTPTITSGVGQKGDYYVVSVAGTTNIDGITDWQMGDWIIFNGTQWQKIDNSDQVTSVNGLQGAVSIGLNNVLSVDNSTGANDISIDSGQVLAFNVGLGGSLNSANTTSIQAWTLPDASGVLALTSDIIANSFYTADGSIIGDRTVTGDESTWLFNQTNFRVTTVDGADFFVFEDVIQLGGAQIENLAPIIIKTAGVTNQTLTFKDLGATPFSGNLQNADLTAFRNWTLPDASGVLALTSDIVAESLADTLVAGNSTGGKNLLVTNGDIINFGGKGSISFNNAIEDRIQVDIEGIDAFFVGSASSQNGMRVDSGGNVSLLSSLVTYQSLTWKSSSFSSGVLRPTTLTGNRTYNLPDDSGTIALTSDIVADTLAETLSAGNSTGANNISIDNNQQIIWNNGSGGVLVSENTTASRSWKLPDGSGTLALTTDFATGKTYTVSNQPTADRDFDANSYTLDEIVNVLSTLIADLKTVNIIS